MYNLDKAKKILVEKDKNLVVVNNKDILFCSDKKGIVPMYDLYKKNITGNIYLADKFIGGGAAKILLNMQSNILELYAHVISKDALEKLEKKNIKISYIKVVEKILNRAGNDLCPVEKLSKEYENFNVFFIMLEKFLIDTKQIRG